MSQNQHATEHFVMDPQRAMLLPPELKASPPESLTEQLFIERSLTENQFWLRIMKEHALFLSEGFDRHETSLIQQVDQFYHLFDRHLQKAFSVPLTVQAVRKLNEESIELVYAFRNYKRNLLILIINCKAKGFNFPLLVDHTGVPPTK